MSIYYPCELEGCNLIAEFCCSCDKKFCPGHWGYHVADHPNQPMSMLVSQASQDDLSVLKAAELPPLKYIIKKLTQKRNCQVNHLLQKIKEIDQEHREKIDSMMSTHSSIQLILDQIAESSKFPMKSPIPIASDLTAFKVKTQSSFSLSNFNSFLREIFPPDLLPPLYDPIDCFTMSVYKEINGKFNEACSFAVFRDMMASSSSEKDIKIWQGEAEINILRGHSEHVSALSFDSSGKFIASGSADKSVKVWEVETGNCIRTLERHTQEVTTVAFSSDNKLIASGGKDSRVIVWHFEDGNVANWLPGHDEAVSKVMFAESSKKIVSGSLDCTIKVWDVKSGELLNTLIGHHSDVLAIAVQGNLIASGSNDQTLRLWSLDTGKSLQVFNAPSEISCVDFSHCGNYIAAGGDEISVWTKEIHVHNYLVNSRVDFLCISDNLLVSGHANKKINLWK